MVGMSRTALAMLLTPALHSPATAAGSHRLADPNLPQLSVLDLAATRGDGIFETISVTEGVPTALEPHLRRFQRSAALLELPEPHPESWRAAIASVIAELDPVEEALVKIVYSRGIEGGTEPTGWVHGSPAPDYTTARTEGISVVMLDRGYRHDIERTSPWLLAGAKTLSYAVNRSVLREAARRGASDVIFVSSDGYVLEGPTSTVLFRRGNTLLTPGTGLGILEGTTQGDIFTWAEANGYATGFEMLTPEQLAETDAIWLVSSGRQAAPIHTLDGVQRAMDLPLTEAINTVLLARKH